MNKDQVKGKVKDVAGRIERQAGEWTGSTETEVRGAAKQAEGKVQNAWGNAKDAVEKSVDNDKANQTPAENEPAREKEEDRQRKAS